MPERDGNALPSEQTHFNLEGLNKRAVRADSLLNLGLKGLNRPLLKIAIQNQAFSTANKNYQQAVECFRYGLYEPAMVMARATIDASLHSSMCHIIDKISGYDGFGGSISGHIKPVGELTTKKLDNEAKVLGLNFLQRRQIMAIRDKYGNFSAHNAERQLRENFKYAKLSEEQRKIVKGPKWVIDERMAYYVLRKTALFLVYIRDTYTIRTLRELNLPISAREKKY